MSVKLSAYVWDGCAAAGMKISSVAIMARLADFSNDEGVSWPSIETIARQIGAGPSTVRTAIAKLEAEGWLTRTARRQGNRNASMFTDLMWRNSRRRHSLTCQILTRQNLTRQNLRCQNPVKMAVFTRQNLAGIRQ